MIIYLICLVVLTLCKIESAGNNIPSTILDDKEE